MDDDGRLLSVGGKLTAQQCELLRRDIWEQWYWPKLVLHNFSLSFYCCICFCVLGVLGFESRHYALTALGLFFGIAVLALLLRRSQRPRPKALVKLNDQLPNIVSRYQKGFEVRYALGVRSVIPWEAFTSWRVTDNFLMLDWADGSGFFSLPCRSCSQKIAIHLFC